MKKIKIFVLFYILLTTSCNYQEQSQTDHLTKVPENFSEFTVYDKTIMDAYKDGEKRRVFLEMTDVNKFWMQKENYEWKDVHSFYKKSIQEYKNEPLLDLLRNKTITILLRDYKLLSNKEVPNEIIVYYARQLASLRSVNFQNSFKLLEAAKSQLNKEEFSKRVEFEIYKLDYSIESSNEIIKNTTDARIEETERQLLKQSDVERKKLQSLIKTNH